MTDALTAEAKAAAKKPRNPFTGFANTRPDGDFGIARALGWFSFALGAAEMFAPRAVARFSGVPPRTGVLRALGAREVGAGLALFSNTKPVGALWNRVAGDAMDLGLLGVSMFSRRARRGRILASLALVGAITALDIAAGRQAARSLVR